MLRHLWFANDAMFFNIRRDSGAPVRHISYRFPVPHGQKLDKQLRALDRSHQARQNSKAVPVRLSNKTPKH